MHRFLELWKRSRPEFSHRHDISNRGYRRHIVLEFLLQLHLSVVDTSKLNFGVKIAAIFLWVSQLSKRRVNGINVLLDVFFHIS